MKPPFYIDALQYCKWNREIFQKLIDTGFVAIHATIAFWENMSETIQTIGKWNRLFRENKDLILPISQGQDIERAKKEKKLGIILGYQNCSPIENNIHYIEIYHKLNVRIMQLSYNNQSPICSGCYELTDSGLTRFGREVIEEMNRVGMLIDMSHSGEVSTLEAIEFSKRPIAITHANPKSFQNSIRNKSNKVLKALSERKGMLGFSLYPFHLKNGSDCSLTEFIEMIAKTVDLMGGVEYVGLGSDICWGQPLSELEWMRNGNWTIHKDYGEGSSKNPNWPKSPNWFANFDDFNTIKKGLLKMGFSDPEVSKIMGENWFHFFTHSFTSNI